MLPVSNADFVDPAKITFNKIQQDNGMLNPLLFSLAGFGSGGDGDKLDMFDPLALGTSAFGGGSGAGANGAPAQQEENPWSYGQDAENEDSPVWGFAEGGLTSIHPMGEPEFHSEGGLNNRYVKGRGDGTSDSIPAMLANDEFVIPADVVSSLGNGSSEAGAGILEQFMYEIRKHKQSNGPEELPPDSLGPLEYLSAAMSKGRRA